MMSPGRRRSHAHIRRGVLCWSKFRLGPWLYLRIASTTAPPTNASWDAGVEPRKYGQARQRPVLDRLRLCCAMDSSTGLARITSSNHPRNLGYTSTELPTERWRRWASQRASSSLPTERARPRSDRPSSSVEFGWMISWPTTTNYLSPSPRSTVGGVPFAFT